MNMWRPPQLGHRPVAARMTPGLPVYNESRARELDGVRLVREGKFKEAADSYFHAACKAQGERAKCLWLLAAENHVRAGGQDERRKAAFAYGNAAELSEGRERIRCWKLAADNHAAGGQPREAGIDSEKAAKQAREIGADRTAAEFFAAAGQYYFQTGEFRPAAYVFGKAAFHSGREAAEQWWQRTAECWKKYAEKHGEREPEKQREGWRGVGYAHFKAADCVAVPGKKIEYLTSARDHYQRAGLPEKIAEVQGIIDKILGQ